MWDLKGFYTVCKAVKTPGIYPNDFKKSSYPIQLLILALGENSFAFPRKLRSLGELHSLKRKEKDITDDNNDTTGSIRGGGEGEGGPNSLPPLPCIPSLMLSLQLYLTLEDSNSLISTPFPKLKFLKTSQQF